MSAAGWILLAGLALAFAAWRFGRYCESQHVTDWGAPWLNRLDGLNRIYCRWLHGLDDARIALPPEGPAVLVSNHVSGADPLVLIAACDRPLRFVIAREQYDRWWGRWLFDAIGTIPVERTGRPERAFYAARQALERAEVVAIFPEGGIRKAGKPVRLKRGAIVLARLALSLIHI